MRQNFRDAVFKRDGYRCIVCGFESSPQRAEHELDAHHVTPRERMPSGGYVRENGVSLCDPSKTGGKLAHGCHYKAEEVLKTIAEGFDPPQKPEDLWYAYAPERLYAAIDSSHAAAVTASEYL